MADHEVSPLSPPSNEDLRIAARQFEYANRAAVGGDFDLAIQCLRTCCKLVPGNLSYRQALRKAQKNKYQNNLRGSLLAPLTTLFARARLWRARHRGDYRAVLEHGEAILSRGPWDKGAQLSMAEAVAALDLPLMAIWVLQQAREKNGNDVQINRALARLLEEQGHFLQAIQLWELVRKAAPQDAEAQNKARELSATETIARAKYEDVVTKEAPGAVAAKSPAAPAPPPEKLTPVKKRAVREEKALRERLGATPSNPEHYLQLAALNCRNGHLGEARAILEQGLSATGQAFELTLALADLEIEPLRQSLAWAEEQLRAEPHEEKLENACGKLRAEINARELACYRQRVKHDSADNNHRFELGVRLLRAGQIEEAICELQAARSEARLQWKALMHLGHCFKARRNWPLARRNFEEALKGMPEGEKAARKELLFSLAIGHADAGELPRAIELALDLANLDYAYRNIGRLLEEWQGSVALKATGK